jgi:hypothetical protein
MTQISADTRSGVARSARRTMRVAVENLALSVLIAAAAFQLRLQNSDDCAPLEPVAQPNTTETCT